MILAYADDIPIISGNINELTSFSNEFVPTAISLGLQLNENKSEILTRNPDLHAGATQIITHLSLGSWNIPLVNKMKYLGDHLNRPINVKDRIKTAYKICYSVLPFFSKNNIPMDILKS